MSTWLLIVWERYVGEPIRILNKYTEEDPAGGEVWVNQKGMPEITASVKDGELVVEQRDPLGRGLKWPQELTYRVICGTDSEEIPVSLETPDSFPNEIVFFEWKLCHSSEYKWAWLWLL